MEKTGDLDPTVHHSYHDVIEMVAAANEHLTDFTYPSDLPELRTSPCLFHHRNTHPHHSPNTLSPHRSQLLYASNFHAGCSPRSTTSKRSVSSDPNNDSMETRIQKERSKLFQQDVEQGQNQTYSKPSLPKSMTSKDFIQSWLRHGSQPNGHSHFPEVIEPPRPPNPSNTLHLKPFNNRQMLAPISHTVKTKKLKR